MKAGAPGAALLGVAIGAWVSSCVGPSEGTPCADFKECGFHEYCDLRIAQCVRWELDDPRCGNTCFDGQFCHTGTCAFRFPAIEITSPAPGSVVPPTFTIRYAATEDPAAAGRPLESYSVILRVSHAQDGGHIATYGGNQASLTGEVTIASALDASIAIVAQAPSWETQPTLSQPVQVFVDQTR